MTNIAHGIAQTARTFIPIAFKQRTAEPVTLLLSELAPAALLGLAYLYNRGQNADNYTSNDDARSLAAVAEGAVTAAVVNNTKNVYPYMALGWAAYEMGTAKTSTDRWKNALKAAILFPLGFIGVHAGQWMNDGLHYRDANVLLRELEPLQGFLAQAPGRNAPALHRELHPLLTNLRTRAAQFSHFMKNPQLTEIKNYTQRFKEAMSAVTEHLGKLAPGSLDALGPGAKQAVERVGKLAGRSQMYQAVRFFNSSFGYVIATTLIGLPLFKLISNAIWRKDSHAADSGEHGESSFKIGGPLWLDRVTGMRGHEDALAEHAHPYNSADFSQWMNPGW